MTNYKLLCKCYHPVETLYWLLILYLRPIKKVVSARMTQVCTMGRMSLHARMVYSCKASFV